MTRKPIKVENFTTSHAFIIGIDNYVHLQSLQTAVNDASKLANVLEDEHDFNISGLLLNAKHEQIHDLLQELPNMVGANDRVLFYFAGHGIAADGEDGTPAGYLLPSDAQRESHDTSISMDLLHKTFEQLECRHFLLILDCCFSGAFKWASNTRGFQLVPKKIYKERYEQYIKDPAWQVITSSAYNEEALDVANFKSLGAHGIDDNGEHSPFALALFEALKGAGDIIPSGEGDGIITATELYLYLREIVSPYAFELGDFTDRHQQTPGIFTLKKHDRGEFIFLSPDFDKNELPSLSDMQLNPYRGLEAYRFGKQIKQNKEGKEIVYEDKDFFYGRERVIKELYEHLTVEEDGKTNNFLVVTGASGTGKSSVVKAGLLPILKEEGYTILPIVRPGKNPISALATAHLPEDKNQLQKHLLLIDQYEELITQCHSEEERHDFIKTLKVLLDANIPDFKLIVTIRSDFEPQFDQLILKDYWTKARKVVPAFTPHELREVIVQPATQRVLHFEPPELVQTIIDEVQQAPGALPLLSFFLSELYQKYLQYGLPRNERALTKEYYDQFGGVMGALRKRADEIFDKFDETHQKTMQKVMLRMVSQEGGELASRRVFLDELVYGYADENKRVKSILKTLTDARLIVQGKEEQNGKQYVEPAHDALVRAWGKLSDWIRKIGEDKIGLLNKLNIATNDHQLSQNNKDLWHDNPRLELVKDEKEKTDGQLNKHEVIFVEKSVQLKRKRRNRLIATLATAVLVLSGLSLFAFMQRSEALMQTEVAKTERSKAEAQADTARLERDNAKRQQGIAKAQADTAKIERDNAEQQQKIAEQERDNAQRQQQIAEAQTDTAQQQRQIAQEEKENAEKTLRETLANDLVFKSDLLLNEGKREQAFQLAEFAHLYTDKNNLKATQQLIKNYHYPIWKPAFPPPHEIPIKTLRHSDGVNVAVFAPDDSKIVTASSDGTIKMWNAQNGKITYVISGNRSIAFPPDGSKIATVSKDSIVKIWNSQNGELMHSLEGHSDYVEIIVFSFDGNKIATASRDGITKIWNAQNGKLIHKLGEDIGHINAIVFSPDGSKIVTASSDGTTKMWNAQNGKLTYTLGGHDSVVSIVAFSPDGSKIATASYDKITKIWDVHGGKLMHALTGHNDGVVDIAFSPDGSKIATASEDNSSKIWDTQNGKLIHTLSAYGPVNAVAFSPDGSKIAATSHIIAPASSLRTDGYARIWDSHSGKLLYALGHSSYVRDIHFSFDGNKIVTASWDNTAKIWDSYLGKWLHTFNSNGGKVVDISLNGNKIALAFGNNTVQIWDNCSGKLQYTLNKHNDNIKTAIFSPDGSKIATVSKDSIVKIWNSQNGELMHSLEEHSDYVEIIVFSFDGNKIATASGDGMTKIWDAQNGKLIHKLGEDVGHINAIVFSPDGSKIVTASRDGTTKMWNAQNGKLTYTLSGHDSTISAIAFSPNGRKIATASYDKIAKIWDVHSGKLIHALTGHNHKVVDIAFSPNGSKIATASYDMTARIWDSSNGKLIHALKTKSRMVNAVVFSPNSGVIATALGGAYFRENTVQLWDIQSGQLMHTLGGHKCHIKSAVFSPSGDKISTISSPDRTAIIWLINSDSIIQKIRQVYHIAPLLANQIQEYDLANAMENGLGFEHFRQTAPAAQLHQFGLYYQNNTRNNNNSAFVQEQLLKAEQCFRAAVQKEKYVVYEEALGAFLAYKREKLSK